ncbi:hypothetical protein PR202_gb04231 [Eleusine coracana subsp. coracana]|uniref:Poly(A) RNA polymerase mitochondrial-like central palm domain-containing protein n=1 Tax=Eleusine coracana subsp. coracana TaxID=191504 RepID=A0AAV5E3S9_ELECO|nr:hypothetical protein PR202_gb04231 [Eleusine coracana subsp. coracana]
MAEHIYTYDLLKTCTKDILSVIKPVEDDRNKRLHAIQELTDTVNSVGALRGSPVKPFGSFVSNLYAKSGDLDVSVDLRSGSDLPISKKKKQNALRELMRALQIRGVARSMHFIPDARVPVLQYISNHFGISCDISINNYPGQIKSRIFYWINTIDDRFGDIVLLVKEWAKAQNINDPKNGTLNSYSLCLLVLFHFQTCEPAILPPLKEIYMMGMLQKILQVRSTRLVRHGYLVHLFLVIYLSQSQAGMAFRDEKHVDEVCVTNKARFLRQNMGQRNQSSVSQLLASFFHKIEDPFERPDNAARAVGAEELLLIGRAFKYVSSRFTAGALADCNELVSLLCTPTVQSVLGDRVRASRYTMATPNEQHQQARSLTGSRSAITSQMFAGRQTAQPSTEHATTSKPVSESASKKGILAISVCFNYKFIPHARVPVLQYVSSRFGISCDISIDNNAGQIKSKIFYWVNSLDERFGDMVLLIKEWAKAQNINDPKTGSLNSYSLCLLVLFHFQTSEPPILPPLKDIYEGNITEDTTEMASYNEDQINEVEDPVERPDNAARAVSMKGLERIVSAFKDAYQKLDSLEHVDRNELLVLLCTPGVSAKLGGRESWLTLTGMLHKGVISKSDLLDVGGVINGSGKLEVLLKADQFREINRRIVQLIKLQHSFSLGRNGGSCCGILLLQPANLCQIMEFHNDMFWFCSGEEVILPGEWPVSGPGACRFGFRKSSNFSLLAVSAAAAYSAAMVHCYLPTILLPNNLGFGDASGGDNRRRRHRRQDFSMAEHIYTYDLLKTCTKDILSVIKPVEDDRNKRLHAIQELTDTVNSVGALRGTVLLIIVMGPFPFVKDHKLETLSIGTTWVSILYEGCSPVKPFGSFVSNLYAKSGDLDVSVDLRSGSDLPISKKKKQNALRELMRALQIRGVARSMHFIPDARVPVLQYISNHFGISCDISINNYPGQIKSRIFYWINTIDDRFGDIVLLVKEWAKAQNINDPKNGTLNSYSLCLLVLFHFQKILQVRSTRLVRHGYLVHLFLVIYLSQSQAGMVFRDEKHVDEVCVTNKARFLRQNMGQRNQSSVSQLLASFFHKFSRIGNLSGQVISTYTGRLQRIQSNRSWMAKSFSLFIEDPFERPDNAARAVGAEELLLIGRAFKYVSSRFTAGALADRNELVSLLCTPTVQSILGDRVRASRYTMATPNETTPAS